MTDDSKDEQDTPKVVLEEPTIHPSNCTVIVKERTSTPSLSGNNGGT